MKISEITLTANHNGCLKIPAPLLKEMGIVPGDHVRVAYLTDDGAHNTFKEFLVTAEGIQGQNEEQRIAIPNQLLRQANIPEDADIQIICLDGILVISHESGMNQDELADVLDSLWTANDITARLPADPETAWEYLKNFTDDKEEVLNHGGPAGEYEAGECVRGGN